MNDYNVCLEFNVAADSPLEAAKTIQGWLDEATEKWQYYVQDINTKKIYSIDLECNDEDAVLDVKANDYIPIIEK